MKGVSIIGNCGSVIIKDGIYFLIDYWYRVMGSLICLILNIELDR